MRRKPAAFTLIEVLLVLAIIGIVVAVAMPTFVRSMRGNRLRAAARTVAAAGRYARSMAVMRQQEAVMILDLDFALVAVSIGDSRPPPEEAVPPEPPAEQPELAGLSQAGGAILRRLDRVRIEEVTSDDTGEDRRDGRFAVTYRTNGTCVPYKVRLSDAEGDSLLVSVDALSSAAIAPR
jgi:prepilin-type N-terminal cleavage/methylation domain-containing protein